MGTVSSGTTLKSLLLGNIIFSALLCIDWRLSDRNCSVYIIIVHIDYELCLPVLHSAVDGLAFSWKQHSRSQYHIKLKGNEIVKQFVLLVFGISIKCLICAIYYYLWPTNYWSISQKRYLSHFCRCDFLSGMPIILLFKGTYLLFLFRLWPVLKLSYELN